MSAVRRQCWVGALDKHGLQILPSTLSQGTAQSQKLQMFAVGSERASWVLPRFELDLRALAANNHCPFHVWVC